MRAARVVGGGLSGLAAASHLSDAGFEVEVVEASGRPGGLIETLRTPDGLVECAANAFVWTETTARWFQRLGLTPAFPGPLSRRRFVFRSGRPRRWPLGIAESLSMAARGVAALGTRRTRPHERESVAAWSARVVGRGATEWLVGPALQGIYGAPADRLCARVIIGRERPPRYQGQRLAAPEGGMGQFIDALVNDLERRGVTIRLGHDVNHLAADVPTVIATSAPPAAALVASHAPALADAIRRVSMTSIVTTTAFFAPHPDDAHGFGVLFPRSTGVEALGVLFNADVFAGRSALRSETWIYRTTGAAATLPSGETIMTVLAADRERLTGRRDAPVSWRIVRRPDALPIYSCDVLDVAARVPDCPPWLALAGNYLGRIGVAALLEGSEAAAARLIAASASRP
ncbi:MAG: FAD-dependent oxidoreductase [Acidobacteria bacterium]|nr:FAD-dependent oxidoreductase [Acidobacteriota bacterium]